VLDAILIAYSVAEQALLPVMINMDAFYLTHTSELVDVPNQEAVDTFLPPYTPSNKVDVDDPKTFGNVCGADLFASIKYRRHWHTLLLEKLWDSTAIKFADHFNRLHPTVEAYRTEDADVCVVGIGTAGGAMRLAVDRLRKEGLNAGSLRLAMMRPFPRVRFEKAISTVRHLIVIDRDVSFGAEGILAQEMKAFLFDRHADVKFKGFIAGVGGKDISAETTAGLVRQALFGNGTAVEAGTSFWTDVLL